MPSSFASFTAILSHAFAAGLLLASAAAHANGQAEGHAQEDADFAAPAKVKATVGLREEPDLELGGGSRRIVVTMLADVSARTSLVFERSRLAPAADPTRAALLSGAPQTKVGVEFRPVSAASAFKPIGALRVQMSDNASLSFKPRRGGLLVSWRSQF